MGGEECNTVVDKKWLSPLLIFPDFLDNFYRKEEKNVVGGGGEGEGGIVPLYEGQVCPCLQPKDQTSKCN